MTKARWNGKTRGGKGTSLLDPVRQKQTLTRGRLLSLPPAGGQWHAHGTRGGGAEEEAAGRLQRGRKDVTSPPLISVASATADNALPRQPSTSSKAAATPGGRAERKEGQRGHLIGVEVGTGWQWQLKGLLLTSQSPTHAEWPVSLSAQRAGSSVGGTHAPPYLLYSFMPLLLPLFSHWSLRVQKNAITIN